MRIKTYIKGGYIDGGFTSGGGTMTGPLILAGDPTQDLQAVTKHYVDQVTASFDAGNFLSGTLQVGRLPAFTGDVVSTTGSNTLSLAGTGVGGGIFTKVTVNAKGLITAGGSLNEGDLPALDWNKITTGKPSTVAGYGITDALTKSGGTVTGSLTLSADPTVNNQAVTKQYVDNSAGNFSVLKVGDIIGKTTSTTPVGFLRCNGGDVSKTTYSALYAAVGDAFFSNTLAQPGAGQPWQQQYNFNQTQAADLGTWALNGTMPNPITQSQMIVTSSRVYILGGYLAGNGSGFGGVYTAPINADGSLGAWASVATSLPASPRDGRAVVGNNNRVYLFIGVNGNTTSASVYSAPINADGTLGTWVACTTLPDTPYDAQVLVTSKYIYVIGGTNNAGTSTSVYVATINADGSLSAWTTSGNLALGVSVSQLVVTLNRVYLLGGFSVASSAGVTTVQTAVINSNGTLGAWTVSAAAALPAAVQFGQTFVTKNRVYLIGGYVGNPSAVSAGVYHAPINADGTIGTWVTGTSLPNTVAASFVIATSGYLYLLGGTIGGSASTSIYSVKITGGLNDYSSYYNGSLTAVGGPAAGNFRLPDLTTTDGTGFYSYIKT